MQQELKVVNTSTDRTDVDGLDGFFAKGADQSNQVDATKALSIKEAVKHYNEPAARIKQMIHDGTIPAVRVSTAKGLAWRVYPYGTPEGVQAFIPKNKLDQVIKKPVLPEGIDAVKTLATAAMDRISQLERSLKQKEESAKKKSENIKAIKATALAAVERLKRQESSFNEMKESFESLADQLVDAHCMISELRAELLEVQVEVKSQNVRKPLVERIWNRLSQPIS